MSMNHRPLVCAQFHRAVELIGRRWSGAIIFLLLKSTARFAAANAIAYETVDGNDVVKVRAAAARLTASARAGQGPGFLEAVTYRWYGHVDWREDIDVGVHRSATELQAWRGRDPIMRLVGGHG